MKAHRIRHKLPWRLVAASSVLVLLLTACGGDDDDDDAAATETETTDDAGEDGGAAADQGELVIAADMVWGPLNIPEDEMATSVCVLKSRYPRNSEVVWRARVKDGATGEELDDAALQSAVVELSDGQTFEMRYGPHPPDTPNDFFWTTSWDIPADYPTGTVDWTITTTHTDGRTGEYQPFNVDPSLLTITDEVLETIEEEEG